MSHTLRRNALSVFVQTGLASLCTLSFAQAATFNVTTADDATTGTFGDSANATNLRAALIAANASGDPTNTITFGAGVTSITLTAPLPLVLNDLTVDGGAGVTIDGGGAFRPFFVGIDEATRTGVIVPQFPTSPLAARLSVIFKNLVLQNGKAKGGAGSGGGMGAGGALFVNGAADVSLENVSFNGNQAVGGSGSAANNGGGGLGGNGGGADGGGGGLFGAGGTSAAGGGVFGSGGSLFGGGGGYTGNGGTAFSDGGPGTRALFGVSGSGGSDSIGFHVGGPLGGGGAGSYGEGGGGGGGFGGANGTNTTGGNGGFGGGGGFYGSNGGFGGGGAFGGSGGFGGGGGTRNGAGGFGGGGGFGDGTPAGNGGFGGGAGAASYTNPPGTGGIGGGNGANSGGSGGGGMGAGGAVFVVSGGSLTISQPSGSGNLSGGSLTAGTGSNNGAAAGSAAFIMTGAGATFDIAGSYTVSDAIADDSVTSLPGPGYTPGNGSGGAAITKQGAGALILAGNNTYSGSTTIQAGTLQVDGSIGDVGVNTGTLSGTGTVGNITLNAGPGLGSIAPGDSPGTLHATSLTWNGGQNFTDTGINFQLGATNSTSDSDLIQTAALNKGLGAQFIFHFSDGNGAPTLGTVYTLIETFSTTFAPDASDFRFDYTGAFAGTFGGSFSFAAPPPPLPAHAPTATGALQFTVTAVTPVRLQSFDVE